MHYISASKFNRAQKLIDKWKKYKSLRNFPEKCIHGHPDFQTMIQRENILDNLISIVFEID